MFEELVFETSSRTEERRILSIWERFNQNPRMTNPSFYDHYLNKMETEVWLASSDKQIFDSSFENFSLFQRILRHEFFFYGT